MVTQRKISMNELSLDNYASTLVEDIKQSIVTEVKQVAQEALINAINQTVYLRQKQYRQTRDFLGAVEVMDVNISDSKATFRVGINPSKIGIQKRMPEEWNAHASMSGEAFNGDGLIDTLDQGSSGSPYYNFDGYGFFDIASDDMDTSLIMAMANALRGKGYKVTLY